MRLRKYINALNVKIFGSVAMVLLVSEFAFAVDNKAKGILTDPKFAVPLTFGFGIYAFYKWVDYFANFSTSNALTAAAAPALLTFLTFQWQTVVGWLGLG